MGWSRLGSAAGTPPRRQTLNLQRCRAPITHLPRLPPPACRGYYSCNGLSADVAPTAPERIDPTYLWRDLLQLHSAFPLHCLVGGGAALPGSGAWGGAIGMTCCSCTPPSSCIAPWAQVRRHTQIHKDGRCRFWGEQGRRHCCKADLQACLADTLLASHCHPPFLTTRFLR